ncbi:kinase-like domain-containing protein [Rhizophagus clarus]|uniref:Kinase-like domain-containing protein n=1 Tax=Rhizophagus clarus TaxID=94130 RepID=A0A8H3MI27_9GLOM|nr:kinase-like domain-containing protein [Rhizophagus clarus]
MVLRYIYGGRLSLEEYDTSDIIKILDFCSELMLKEPGKIFNSIDFTSLSEKCMISLIRHDNLQMSEIQVWEQVLKWGISRNPGLPLDPSNYSKDDFNVLKNTLQQCIPFIKFFNLSHKEFLDKVYPYKKILPKDLRENLIKNFINQPPEPNITKEIVIEKDFNIIVDEINDFIYKKLDETQQFELVKQKVIKYFNEHNINAQEIYNWLLNNQISTNSIFLLGYFNSCGIVTSNDNEKAFNLFINASEKNHTLAQIFVHRCYKLGYGTMKNEELSFKYCEKAANNNFAIAQVIVASGYGNGMGIKKDLKKAFYWHEKAAKNGNIIAVHGLGHCYLEGIGIEKDYNKAFELFRQSADGGYSSGIMMLGLCYDKGIGTNIDKKKAFELYQNAANLGDDEAQINLALMYERGVGITKDINQARYWYEKAANQGHEQAKNSLKRLQNQLEVQKFVFF